MLNAFWMLELTATLIKPLLSGGGLPKDCRQSFGLGGGRVRNAVLPVISGNMLLTVACEYCIAEVPQVTSSLPGAPESSRGRAVQCCRNMVARSPNATQESTRRPKVPPSMVCLATNEFFRFCRRYCGMKLDIWSHSYSMSVFVLLPK